jgi:ribosomal protein S18 acetylase RimI-like enzyme
LVSDASLTVLVEPGVWDYNADACKEGIMAIEVIKARKKHLWDIRALYRAFVIDEYQSAPVDREELRKAEDRTNAVLRLLDEFQNPTRTWLVAVESDIVVGTALLTVKSHPFLEGMVGRIDLVVVSRDRRNQGIGKALLQKADELAKAQGCAWATLDVLKTNESAIQLYRNAGFDSFLMEMVKKLEP